MSEEKAENIEVTDKTEKIIELPVQAPEPQNPSPEVKEEQKTEEPKVVVESNDDIFITENTLFDGSVSYYRENNEIKVLGVDDDYKPEGQTVKTISFKCKYPSQADYQTILNSPLYKNMVDMRAVDLVLLELTRLSLLIREWSIKNRDLSALLEIDPKIVKGMLKSIRDSIDMKGIF